MSVGGVPGGSNRSTTTGAWTGQVLRRGAQGAAVEELQALLKDAGHSPGALDGVFGGGTEGALRSFQRERGLTADGVAGPRTMAALRGAAPAPANTGTPAPVDVFTPSANNTRSYSARGTGYYPANNAMEGGFEDRRGAPLRTLQDFLAGRASYVSVAMDSTAFPYGTRMRIPELEAKYGRPIEFRVVDTGGAFRGQGTSRIDICTADRAASMDATINGPLTLVVAR